MELGERAAGVVDRQEVVDRRALDFSLLPIQLLDRSGEIRTDGALGRHLLEFEGDHGGLGLFDAKRPAEAAFLDVHALVAELDGGIVLLEVGQQHGVGVGGELFGQHVVGVVGEVQRAGDVGVVQHQRCGLIIGGTAELDLQIDHADVAGNLDAAADECQSPVAWADCSAMFWPPSGAWPIRRTVTRPAPLAQTPNEYVAPGVSSRLDMPSDPPSPATASEHLPPCASVLRLRLAPAASRQVHRVGISGSLLS